MAAPDPGQALTDPRLRRASVNGTDLAYDVTGQGPAVVLLHGFSLDLRMWDEQVPPLSRRFRVLRSDRRGFGRSALPEPGVPFSTSEDLRSLLAYLEIPKVHPVGLSAGGGLAVNFALEHPGLVDRIVLVDAALDGFEWSRDWTESWNRIEEAAQREGVGAARHLWLSHPLFAPAREQPEVAKRLAEIVRDYSGWHWLHDTVAQGMDPPAAKRLESVMHPTLVLIGERGIPDFRAIARLLADKIPGARAEVIPRAGHMLNMESPSQFDQSVLRFLEKAGSYPSSRPLG